jgi:hypothetical protein
MTVFMYLLAIGLTYYVAPAMAVQADKGQPLTKKAPLPPTQPQPASSQKSSPGGALPLIVQQIDTRDGQVTVIIDATGQLPADAHETTVLRVVAPGMLQPQTFPLSQVDPGRSLSKTGGRVSFNTKILPKIAGVMTATLARGQWTASKQTPVTLKMAQIPPELARMTSPMQAQRAAPRPPDTPPPPPTVLVDWPRAGDTIFGDPMSVHWSVGGFEPGQENNEAIVLLKNGVELQRVGPFNFTGRTRRQTLSMFGRLNGADYQAKVELFRFNTATSERTLVHSHATGYFNYMSNILTESEAQPVIMHEPTGFHGEVYPAGSSIHVMWGCLSSWRTGSHPVRLTLVRDSTEGGGEWPIRDSINCATFELDWTIPVTVPPGAGYRILVQSLEGTGASTTRNPFSIGAPP